MSKGPSVLPKSFARFNSADPRAIFYVLSVTVLLNLVYGITTASRVVSPAWDWPLAWMGSMSAEVAFTLVLFGATMFSAAALFPNRWWLRGLAAAAWMLCMTAAYPSGKFANNIILWPGVALIFALPVRPATALRMAQVFVLFSYFSSGLWKLRTALNSVWLGEFGFFISQSLPTYLGYGLAEGSATSSLPLQLIQSLPGLASALWVTTIFLELGAIVALFRPGLQVAVAFSLLMFHTGVAVMMGPAFAWQALLVIFLLLL